jgi:hypothetical protein
MRTMMGDVRAGTLCRGIVSKQAVLLLFVIMLMLLSLNCVKTPAEAVMPSWQTQLTLPIVDRTYYFSELVAKDDKYETLVNGEVVYRPTDVLNTPTAITMPTVTPIEARVSNTLGAVPLTLSPLPEIDLSVTQLLGEAPPQQPWGAGDMAVVQNQPVLSDTAMFDYVTFESARITIRLANTMNFDVIFPSGIKVFNVFSATDTSKVLVTFPVGLLKAGQSMNLSADISGLTMSSRLELKYLLQTVGLNGTVLTPTGKLAASMVIDRGYDGTSPTLREAKVLVTSDYGKVSKNGFMKLIDDSTYIKRAEFSSGGFNLTIANIVPVDLATGLVIDELVNKRTGQPFRLKVNGTGAEQDEVVIPANTTFVQAVDLSNYTFVSKNISGSDTMSTDGVHYTMTVRSVSAADSKRVIAAGDSISVAIVPKMIANTIQPLTVSKFEGVIKPTIVTINETVKTDFGIVADKFSADSIKFDNATIVLKLFTKTTYPADITLRVTAWHNGVKGLSMNVPGGNGGLNGAYRIIPGDTARIVFNKSTTTSGISIDQFMNSFTANGKIELPDKLVLEGTGIIEPVDVYKNGTNGKIGSVTDRDSISSSLEFYFPVRVAIQNGIFRDTTEFTNTLEKDKLDLLETGKVTFQIENTFPVEGDVSLMMMGSKSVQDTLLNLTKTPLHIESAVYNASGENASSRSYSFVTLAKGEASKFYAATCAAVKAHMQTSGNKQPVAFRSTDHIRVKAYGTFDVNVDFNKMK